MILQETSAEPKTLRIVYDESRSTPDLEKSQEIFQSMRESVINNDVELLEHIETQEQVCDVCTRASFTMTSSEKADVVAGVINVCVSHLLQMINVCVSYLLQMINVCVSYLLQFCMNNGLSMSAKNMDTMYRAMMVSLFV